MHKILEYLFYKIQVLTRYMDTSMYLNIHVPFIMSTVLLFYLADIAIIYYYIIMGYSPQKIQVMCFGGFHYYDFIME